MAENLQHEDFGEKIGGAKKDLWKDRGLYVDDLGAMNEREAEKFVKKDNVWKKPDYQAMLDDGVPLGVVYFIKKARDSLGASPQYRYSDKTPELRRARQEEYIETVRQLQAVIEDVRTLDDAMQAYDRFLIQNGYVEQVQGWASGTHYRATKKSLDNPVITNKLVQALHIRSASHFDRDFTQKAQQEQFGVSKDQKMPKGYAIHFNDGKNTYSRNNDWKPGTYYVTKGYSILQTNLESREAALKWVQDFARQRSKGGKVRFTPPQLAHVRRTGPDYRSGQEITGQHYLDTFGFRGGEFGNWMNQNDRQASLNMGFEALKDLAAALQISDQDIAFGGTLAIAFGARGSGNAAAHYEPLRKVINLTKMHGAGSLAHEWWHGFDDYLGAKMGAKGMLSEQPRLYPLFQKLIDTMKYKPETPEQAAKRTEAQNSRTKKNAASWLDSAVLGSLKRYGNESTLEQYVALWNAVEKAERGKNAQLAYSFDIALQNEFSLEENIALARQFLLENFVSRGMVVDFAVHQPDREDGGIPNPHFHVLCPIRPIEQNGKWGLKQRRVYELDEDGNRIRDANGKFVFNAVPTTDWGSPETLEHWREAWAELCNAKFAEKGIDVRIDHRSYERQGVDLLPTVHEGATVRVMEKKGIRTEKGEFNRWIKATNAVIRDIKKKITLLFDWIAEAKAELAKPQAPNLVSLLNAYYTSRNAGAYSQKGKVSNLKEMNETFNYLRKNGIYTLEDLESHVNEHSAATESLKKTLDEQTARMKAIKQLYDSSAAFQSLKPVYDGLQKIKFEKPRAKYKAEHEAKLKQFYAARRKLTGEFPDGKVDMKKLTEEYDELEQAHETTYGEFKTVRDDLHRLWKVKSCVDTATRFNERAEEQKLQNRPQTRHKKEELSR